MTTIRLQTLRLSTTSDVLRARQVVRATCEALDLSVLARTRVSTAAVEMCRNTVTHGGGGKLILELTDRTARTALWLRAIDEGPGISERALAIARDEREPEAGGADGLGLGLRGIARLSDGFDIESGDMGSVVAAAFDIGARDDIGAVARSIGDRVVALHAQDKGAALVEQNHELLRTLSERDTMLRELHHRTQNNLALITALMRLRAQRADSDETASVLEEMSSRIQAIGAVHALLQSASEVDRVELKPFAVSILEKLCEGAGFHGIKIDVSGDNPKIPTQQATELGILINELGTNAIKHAFADHPAPRLELAVTELTDGIKLELSDNGPGLPPMMQEPHKKQSLGWNVVRSVVAKYQGSIDTSSEDGLRITIRLRLGTMQGSLRS